MSVTAERNQIILSTPSETLKVIFRGSRLSTLFQFLSDPEQRNQKEYAADFLQSLTDTFLVILLEEQFKAVGYVKSLEPQVRGKIYGLITAVSDDILDVQFVGSSGVFKTNDLFDDEDIPFRKGIRMQGTVSVPSHVDEYAGRPHLARAMLLYTRAETDTRPAVSEPDTQPIS